MTKKEHEVVLKFMKITIEKVNDCMANLYVFKKIIIENKIVSEQKFDSMLRESKKLPQYVLGKKVLDEMLERDNI